MAKTAAFSDAAATVIGNFTSVEDPNIMRSLAKKIYPDTDIGGEWVTIKVGELSQKKVEEALDSGLSKAYSLCQKELIKGALIVVQGKAVWTNTLDSWLRKLD